ncbi:MAG: MEDS domain-containing protein [Acidimicrobiales bacterium]
MSAAGQTRTDHLVHFYDREEELVASVSRFLAEGLAQGDPAVMVGVPEHTKRVVDALGSMGIDTTSASQTGELTLLDAHKMLESFMVEDQVDPARFEETLDLHLGRFEKLGKWPRVYGEMVAVLWDAGRATSALELEALWNKLGAGTTFGLLCGYPSASIPHGRLRAEVCNHHSALLGINGSDGGAASSVSHMKSISATSKAPASARAFVLEVLDGWSWTGDRNAAALVTSELTTNALLHGRAPINVTVAARVDRVQIAVRDRGVLPPRQTEPTSLQQNGRGLRLVEKISVRWGADVEVDGKTIWADLIPGVDPRA